MTVRVGMTTDPEERRQYWESQGTVKNWSVMETRLTYDEAQAMEERLVRYYGYEASSGGRRVRGRKWSVYRFEY